MKTAKDFKDALRLLVEEHEDKYDGSLEEFFRGTYGGLAKLESRKYSHEALIGVLRAGFGKKPPRFTPEWFAYVTFPEDDKVPDDFDFARHALLYSIADLRRMDQEGMLDQDPVKLFMGIKSQTGATWANLDPFSFLECALDGLDERHLTKPSWRILAAILILGRKYDYEEDDGG